MFSFSFGFNKRSERLVCRFPFFSWSSSSCSIPWLNHLSTVSSSTASRLFGHFALSAFLALLHVNLSSWLAESLQVIFILSLDEVVYFFYLPFFVHDYTVVVYYYFQLPRIVRISDFNERRCCCLSSQYKIRQ